jgi:carbamoyltransferase
MRILGIHDGHNASVALLEDGAITFALQEERPTNQKNFFGFPKESLRILFEKCGLAPKDIDAVALSSRYISAPMTTEDVRARFGWQGRPLALVAKKISKLSLVQKLRERASMKRRLALLNAAGFSENKVRLVDHHTCHAAAAYYGLPTDPQKKYLVLTLDGGGDWLCATVRIAEKGAMALVAETPYGHSLGDLYSRTTYMMGFTPWEHEYKLMGMAPYASKKYTEKVAAIYRKYLGLDPRNPLAFKRRTFEDTNHILPRLERDLKRQRFDTIAGGLQQFTEELIVEWVRACVAKTGVRDLLLSGGVFMNIKANKAIADLPEVESVSAFPSCGDESNALGAAWWLYRELTGAPGAPLRDYYLGPEFSEQEIETALAEADATASFEVRREPAVNRAVARLVAGGEIVARASGRLEFGARALGNRSIFADPSRLEVITVLNALIKSRDFWMPFAPIMLARNADRYLVNPKRLSSPYMMMGFDTTGARADLAAAIHPADKSARAQILESGQNPDMEEILEEFERATGRAVLLNTSFNLHGYPIVFGPKEALETFRNSGLKHLALGNFLISKR